MDIKNFLFKFYLQKIKRLSLPRDLIRFAVKANYHKAAVMDWERKITYGQLYERAVRLANALTSLGLYKGARLATLLYNCQECLEIRVATYLTGVVLVPIVSDSDMETVISILTEYDITALIYHPEIPNEHIAMLTQKTHVKHLICISKNPQPNLSYEDLLQKENAIEPEVTLKGDDLASVNFSSGTTGKPKGILLTHGSWAASFYNYVLNSPRAVGGQRVILHSLSLATAGGTSLLPVIFIGATSVFMKRFDVEEAASLISKYGANTLFLSPGLLIELLDYCKGNNLNLAITGIAVGIEPMPQVKFKEAIEFFGPAIQQGYGMAETLPPLTLLCSKDYLDMERLNEARLLSVGKPLKGVKIKIQDANGRKAPCGKTGRIVIKSATIAKGYYRNEELTKNVFRRGHFYSDDFGHIDNEGYLYILGRKQDFIKEDGAMKLFSRHIEEVLHAHPGVLLAYAFINTNGKIIACVSLRRNSQKITGQELLSFCKERVKAKAGPDEVIIVSKMPINASGKLDRQKIMKEKEF